MYLQLLPIFSNYIHWGSPCLGEGKSMQMLAVGRKKIQLSLQIMGSHADLSRAFLVIGHLLH